MNFGLVGAYWNGRALTLRGYCDFVRDFLEFLRDAHSAFAKIQWVGDGKQKAVDVGGDMGDLDDLVYRFSWTKKHVRGERNSDGTPTWAAENLLGYQMVFNTGQSSAQGGVTISIHAGDPGNVTPNAITISFPASDDAKLKYRDFFLYDFLLAFLVKTIRVVSPEAGS